MSPARVTFSLCSAAALLAAACSHSGQVADPSARPRASAAPPSTISPRSDRLFRPDPAQYLPADGRAVLIPVLADPAAPPPSQVRIQVGDDEPVDAPIWWLGPTGSATGARGWFGPGADWSASPAPAPGSAGAEGERRVSAARAYVSVPPESVLTGAAVRLNGERVPIRTIAPPSGEFDFAAPGGNTDPANAFLLRALAEVRANPWATWRARLAAPGFDTTAPSGSVARDSVAARLGLQRSLIWSVALQRLARADRQAARELAVRLAGAVDFSDAAPGRARTIAPVWTDWPGPAAADDGLGLLLSDLLADDLSDRDKAARTRAWLQTLPTGAAFVIDDAGPGAAVALVNLDDAPAAASLAPSATSGASAQPLEMLTIPPMTCRVVRLAPDPASGPLAAIDLRIGAWRGRASIAAAPLPASPPGFAVGPLVCDLDMPCLARSAATGECPSTVPPPELLTVGSLMQTADRDGGVRAARWTLFLECRRRPGADSGATVHVLFGPTGQPRASWRIALGGQAVLRQSGGADPGQVTQSAQPDRWSVFVPVPASAIEPAAGGRGGGVLRFGIVREDVLEEGAVLRTAWPRPIAPWVPAPGDPGRIAIDLSAWAADAPAPSIPPPPAPPREPLSGR